MKVTLDIDDALLIAAKAVAVRRETTLAALVEDALRRDVYAASATGKIETNHAWIEISPYGIPRLKRTGSGTVTTEMVRHLMDENRV